MNKKIFIFLLISILFSNYSFVFAYPAYTQNSALSIVGPYDTAVSGGSNWNAQPPYREFGTIGQKYRIRQNGTIRRIKLYTVTKTAMTGFYLKIWRKTGVNSYDLVGTSENLVNSLVQGGYATIDLASPIAGVREGDYYSYRVETSGSFYAKSGVTGVNSYYVTGTTPSETGYAWESQTSAAGWVVPIEIYMYAPQVAFIGDSIIAGHPTHYSFIEATTTTNINSTIEAQFGAITSYTYQNMGIGSQTTTQISARFANDIIALKPRVAVIEGGVNDIGGGAAKSTFIANWTSMLNAAQAEPSIKTIAVLKILPWTNGTNTKMQTRDDWNASLVELASGYSKAVIVDASSYVGQFRVGGDTGNLWDIQPAYNADGVHFNQAGHAQIAQAIADVLNTVVEDVNPPTITSITSTNEEGSYGAGRSISLTVNFSEEVNSTGVTLTLNTTPVRSCEFSVSWSSSGTCEYVVQIGDEVSALEISDIEGVIKDTWDNQLVNFSPSSNLSATKNIEITGELTTYPPYEPNQHLVKVGGYDEIISGAGTWGCGLTPLCTAGYTRDFITIGQKYRIRQAGTIKKVRFYTVSTNNITGFYIKIWRKTGANSYNLVGTSNNIAPNMVGGSINEINLTSPITGVQEGDYYSYRIESLGLSYPLHGNPGIAGVTTYYTTNEEPSEIGYAWESKTAGAGAVVPFEFFMDAPQFVFIGDEITAGHPDNYSFLETTATTDITSTMENQFSDLTGYSYQNMGIGGQTTAQIAERFDSDALELKPRAIVIQGGTNDIIADVDKAVFLANLTSMLDLAQASADTTSVFIMKILPWTNGTNIQMQTRDDWNASLVELASEYSKAVIVDASSYVGQFRAGGDADNLWDIKTTHDSDGLNYNETGLGQIALAIADSLDIGVPTITNVTSSNITGSYKFGDTIRLILEFSETVNATSSVIVTLNTTPERTCESTVSGSASSTCDYVVQVGDNVETLNVASIVGSIADLVDNLMVNFVPAVNLSASKTIAIDTVAPAVSISSFPIVNNANKSATAISGTCSENGLPVSLDIGGITATPTCSSGAWSTTVDLHTLTDGTITANISQTDTAGNTGSNSLTSTKDTGGPAVTGLSNDSTPKKTKTWTWNSGEESATFRYAIDQVLTWTADGDFASTTTAIQSNGNGTYYLHVQAQDGAGNASEVATVSAILDNTPPVITVSGDNPATVAQDSTYTDDGATATDNIDSSVTVTASGTVDIATLGDYTITYNAADVAGNAATSATRLVHVTDQTPPTISELSDDSTPRKTKTWAWSGEEGDTFRFAVDRNATTTLEGEYGDVTTATQAGGNGTYYLHVQSKDAAGNESEAVTIFAFLDNTAPTITITNPNTENAQSKILTAITSDGLLTMSITTGSVCDGSLIFVSYEDHTFSSESDNGKKICYKAIDTAANAAYQISEAIGGIDATPPSISELSDDLAPVKSKTWNWSGEAETAFRFAIDQNSSWTPIGIYGDDTTATQAGGNGTYYLHVQSKDAAGNESEAVTVSAVLDNTAPVITIAGDNPISIRKGSDYNDAGATATDNIDNDVNVDSDSNVNSDIAGDYTVIYVATDTAGNEASSVRAVTVEASGSGASHSRSQQQPGTASPAGSQAQMFQQIGNLKIEIARLQGLLGIASTNNSGSGGGGESGQLCVSLTKDLYYGLANDRQVRCLQNFLVVQGAGIYPEAKITGNFYQLTRAAVIRFQEKYQNDILIPFGLTHGNGFVGSKTRQVINRMIGSGQ